MTATADHAHADAHVGAHVSPWGPRVPHISWVEATRDLMARPDRVRNTVPVLVFALLTIIGIVSLFILLGSQPSYPRLGYVAGVLAFLLGAPMAAPIIAFITRLAKGYWAIPLRRAAEIFYLTGLVTLPLFLVMVNTLPDFHNRPSIWNNWPGAPVLWDSIFMVIFAFTGLAMFYFTTMPDYVAARDLGYGGWRAKLAPSGWKGTPRQWQCLTAGLVILGAFYVMLYVYFHVFWTADFNMSLVPGWKSSIYPGYHALSGFQAGLGLTLLTLAIMRHTGHLHDYVPMDTFWSGAKMLLALSLLFFYFTWSEFILPWYGRMPGEQAYLSLMMFGPYRDLFLLSLFMNWIFPWWFLIWNPVRVSINGPAFAGAVIVVGNLLDRMRLNLASWSVAGPVGGHGLDPAHLPPTTYPQLPELLVVIGALSAVALVYALGLRLVPPVSLWEFKTSMMLKVERRFLAHPDAIVVAKPK